MKNQTISEMIHFYGIRGLLNLIADECEQETYPIMKLHSLTEIVSFTKTHESHHRIRLVQ